MDRWVGKTAVVTGASAGIGAAIAVSLAKAGMTVVGLARREKEIQDLNDQVNSAGSIIGMHCDLRNTEDMSTTFHDIEEKFGGADVLVNNAGMHISGHITDVGDEPLSDTDVLSILDLNLKSVILSTRLAVASMKRREVDGHIVIINSVAGHYEPFAPTFNIYPTTKHGITCFGKALLNEFAHFDNKIKVTSVSPGLVSTELTAAVLDQHALPALQPADVADAVLYAISTPPNVIIRELTIGHVAEKLL